MDRWDQFFKPETRTGGRRLFNEEVRVSRPSDTEVQGYVKTYKVSLKATSVESPHLFAICSCPASKKEQLCKHAYAILLATEDKFPDFLEDKQQIEAKAAPIKAAQAIKPEMAQARAEAQAAMKEKQALYRKVQYQQQKLKLQKMKLAKRGQQAPSEHPEEIQTIINYFTANGFPMQSPLQSEDVKTAKKKLSRVFHPDFGGSHDEITELNQNCEILLDYISTGNGT